VRHSLPAGVSNPSTLAGRLRAVALWTEALPSASRILNVGCGMGWLERHVASGDRDLYITGVEPIEEDLATVRQLVSDPRVNIQVASGLALPFTDGTFDAVVASEVLEHLPVGTENIFLSELSRVIRPGGHVLLTTPAATFRSTITDPAWWLTKHRHYKGSAVVRLASRNDLEPVQVSVRGGWADVLSILDLYIAKWLFRRPPFLESFWRPTLDRNWLPPADGGFFGLWIELRKTPA